MECSTNHTMCENKVCLARCGGSKEGRPPSQAGPAPKKSQLLSSKVWKKLHFFCSSFQNGDKIYKITKKSNFYQIFKQMIFFLLLAFIFCLSQHEILDPPLLARVYECYFFNMAYVEF